MNTHHHPSTLARAALFAALLLLPAAAVAWDPPSGDWSKSAPTDLRVMTWNINSRLGPDSNQGEVYSAWAATARIIAGMQPDVLLLQELGDSLTLSQAEQLLDELFYGGPGIDAWVRKYAPDYELPYVYVSTISDGFNRNAVLSRFPFADLNQDGAAVRPDIPTVSADAYAPGGDGGVRGFLFADIDLPDDTYLGDLVVGNAHLKAFASGHPQRIAAAQNVAYYVDYVLNGAGTGIADPHDKIRRLSPNTVILDPNTPVILAGDWNEDELKNGSTRGPATWLTEAAVPGPTDGTDRDRGDMQYDDAVDLANGDRATQSNDKLDYIAWQDAIATLRRAWVFNTTSLNFMRDWLPPEIVGFTRNPAAASGLASDHLPVLADFELPLVPTPGCGDANCDGVVDFFDIDPFVIALVDGVAVWELSYDCDALAVLDLNDDATIDFFDIDPFVTAVLEGGCPQ